MSESDFDPIDANASGQRMGAKTRALGYVGLLVVTVIGILVFGWLSGLFRF
jgi:hypothetical protein